MKKLSSLLTGLSFGLSVSFAFAEQPPGPPGGEGRPHPPRDCSKAPDAEKKARCEAFQKAMEKCKDMKPEEHRACMKDSLPKKDQ